MSCSVIYKVAGDTGPDLYTTFEGVDLDTLNGLSVTLRYADGGELNRDAIIDDAPAGEFHIEWQTGDIVEGVHSLEYVITDAADYVTRLPAEESIKMIVRAQV